jgi:hypothetical protein
VSQLHSPSTSSFLLLSNYAADCFVSHLSAQPLKVGVHGRVQVEGDWIAWRRLARS